MEAVPIAFEPHGSNDNDGTRTMIALQVFCFVVSLLIAVPTAIGIGRWAYSLALQWCESRCGDHSGKERPTNLP
jgi:hypothetical protein